MKNRNKKENKSTKKHRRIFWIFVFFLVVGIGVTSYILLFSAYTRRVEREAMATGTVQEEIYSFKSRRDLLSLTPEVKRAALYGRATEIDYGTYIIPGLNTTETQVFGEKNTSSICTSMTPQGLAVLMFMILIYLLSKIIIEKNAQSISMVKILGYSNREISRLYIVSTSIMVVLFLLLSLPVEYWAMEYLFRAVMLESISGWITFYIESAVYVKMFLLGIGTYAVVAALEYRRICRVPMDEALKNVE